MCSPCVTAVMRRRCCGRSCTTCECLLSVIIGLITSDVVVLEGVPDRVGEARKSRFAEVVELGAELQSFREIIVVKLGGLFG